MLFLLERKSPNGAVTASLTSPVTDRYEPGPLLSLARHNWSGVSEHSASAPVDATGIVVTFSDTLTNSNVISTAANPIDVAPTMPSQFTITETAAGS